MSHGTKEGLQTVAIGVGVLAEAYISFGWLAVVIIMIMMGIFYDAYRTIFFSSRSGLLMMAVGIALLPQMVGIESQMAGYLGGLVQQIVFILIIFAPVIRWRRKEGFESNGRLAVNPGLLRAQIADSGIVRNRR